jgi:hypothetical protein
MVMFRLVEISAWAEGKREPRRGQDQPTERVSLIR